ncbi:MAG: GntR family transcriptional regulator [Candidatus Sumerlaeota bacterium]|nr:GntR family transcriptional regulator [Candidatus Sumerlaeota bacterium]
MLFRIDLNSPKPVYQQVIDQVKYAVAAGRLRAGDRLPAIRDVATQTRVNRNTVARAYLELEREGVIRTNAGQGSFVRDEGPAGVHRARARRVLADLIDEMLAQARQFQMAEAEVIALVNERLSKVELE